MLGLVLSDEAEIFVGKFIKEAEEETCFVTQYEKDLWKQTL